MSRLFKVALQFDLIIIIPTMMARTGHDFFLGEGGLIWD